MSSKTPHPQDDPREASTGSAAAWNPSSPLGHTGERIGPYKLLSILGEGGFGTVYLAEQEQPVRRRVALKIIKLGMDTKQVIARFEAERQALAMMDHPNVAKVFDAGATDLGRPYFVMEHVPGIPITEHCDLQQLTIKERLDLFILVCEAVQHAHQKGIIHRDIKPSNVLVTVRDGKAIPKVIDFGVAKATAAQLTEKTIYTEQGQLIGTPEYMSPEQAEMNAQDIDTRSDIYSLGVLLYELLTGMLPFDPKTLRSAAYGEIQRIIREVEPPKPSTRLSAASEATTHSAQARHLDVASLERNLRGDLDWITMKAMEKDRTRRYGSASELAADLNRHLHNEPVLAGPPSASYRLRKFVRRNRAGVTSAAAFCAIGLVAAGLIWRSTTVAATERSLSERVQGFLVQDLFGANGFGRGSFSFVGYMEFSSHRAAERLDGLPWAELPLQGRLADELFGLGELTAAEFPIHRCIQLSQSLELHDEHLKRLWQQFDLAYRQGNTAKLDSLTSELSANIGDTEAVQLTLALYHANELKASGNLDEAQRIYDDVVKRRTLILGANAEDTLIARFDRILVDVRRGDICRRQDRAAEAELHFNTALPAMILLLQDTQQSLGGDADHSLAVASELASLHNRLGDFEPAKQMYETTLKAMNRVYGEGHWRTLETVANFARLYQKWSEKPGSSAMLENSLPLYEQALQGYRRIRGPAYSDTVTIAKRLANAYEASDRPKQAGDLLAQTYFGLTSAGQPATEIACEIRNLYIRQGETERAAQWSANCGDTKSH